MLSALEFLATWKRGCFSQPRFVGRVEDLAAAVDPESTRSSNLRRLDEQMHAHAPVTRSAPGLSTTFEGWAGMTVLPFAFSF